MASSPSNADSPPSFMKFNVLHEFIAVAERGSLRAAARQLEIAQPALTRSMQELEKELGVVLFERCPTGVSLTSMGEVFLRRSRSASSELIRARDEMHQLRGASHGQVRVCLSSVAHIALMPRALRPFRERYPAIKIDLIDGLLPSVENELRDGTIDWYIGPISDQPAGELAVEKLFDNTRVVLSRAGHELAHARSLRELTGAQWVTTSITHVAEDELTPLFRQHGLPAPKIVVKAHSAMSWLYPVVYSNLLAMLPIQWANMPLFEKVLQPIRVAEPLPAPPICIAWRKKMPMTPAAQYFCDAMRQAARESGRAAA